MHIFKFFFYRVDNSVVFVTSQVLSKDLIRIVKIDGVAVAVAVSEPLLRSTDLRLAGRLGGRHVQVYCYKNVFFSYFQTITTGIF